MIPTESFKLQSCSKNMRKVMEVAREFLPEVKQKRYIQ